MCRANLERVLSNALSFNFAQGAPSAEAIAARDAELSAAILSKAVRYAWVWHTLAGCCAAIALVTAGLFVGFLACGDYENTLRAGGVCVITTLVGVTLALPRFHYQAKAATSLQEEKDTLRPIAQGACTALLKACAATPEGEHYRQQVLAQHRQFVRAEFTLLTNWAAGANQRAACAALYQTKEA